MEAAPTRKQRRALERENAKRPKFLTELPREQWPHRPGTEGNLRRVWVSQKYIVELHHEGDGLLRMAVNRTSTRPDGRLDDNLTWDELQRIKSKIGFGGLYAVEVYPADNEVVNIGNRRHLWILPAPLVGWVKGAKP